MIKDLMDIQTAHIYGEHLKSRPADYAKPVVYFTGEPVFDTSMFEGHEVAHVRAVNHPYWGNDKLRTSTVLKKNEDGSFETRNTIYTPWKGQQ